MNWNRSETLALAKDRCTYCQGAGLLEGKKSEDACHCVYRAIFRACYHRFQECAAPDVYGSRISPEQGIRREQGGINWSLKEAEYVADFCAIAKRNLTEEEHRIFRFHFLLGADYRLCCRRLNMDRGLFFHHVYRIQRKLGKAFRETQPYGLYPLPEYFNGPRVEHKAKLIAMKAVEPPVKSRQRIWKELPLAA